MPKNDLFEDATRVWKMLDEMALNDPVGYKKFIDQQLKAGRKSVAPPEVRFVIKATLKQSGKKLYVNYLEWSSVPEAKTEVSPIIVKCGELFDLDENMGITLAFNPNVFVQHGFGALPEDGEPVIVPQPKDRREEDTRYQLIWLGLHYLEKEKQLTTVESNSVICMAVPLRPKILNPSCEYGSQEVILKSIGFQKRLLRTQRTHSPAKETDNVEQVIQGVLKDITPENVGNYLPGEVFDASNVESIFTTNEPFKLPQVAQATKRSGTGPLIQEVTPQLHTAEMEAAKGVQEVPIQWHAEVIASVNKESRLERPNQLKVVFELPGVQSGSQCDLDITAEKLLLLVVDSPVSYKPLEITLPCKVDTSNAEAKFCLKRENLTLLVPIMSSKS